MRDLDLFKVIIIASLALMIPAGGWIYWQKGELETAERALDRAERSTGTLFEIGQLQQEVEIFNDSVGKAGEEPLALLKGPMDFFAPNYGYQFQQVRERVVDSRDRIKDVLQPVLILKDEGSKEQRRFSRDEIFKMLFAVERGSMNDRSSGSPIWKLRSIKLRHSEVKVNSKSAPPDELSEDAWEVRDLVFGRRAREQGGR